MILSTIVVVRGGGDHRRFVHSYDSIITRENIFQAWQQFLCGKKKKHDVIEFRLKLIDSITVLFEDLSCRRYVHGPYTRFVITDPKRREIHKSLVRDRVVHHLLYSTLLPYFDKKFIHDSYSCRPNKGTHRALIRFKVFVCTVSKNNTRPCWVLKCDIRKFFASIDHAILKTIVSHHIKDKDLLGLLQSIIDSFVVRQDLVIGLPLGNLTSQLLVNVYMDVFDQFVKHTLKIKYYIRYADDFVICSEDKQYLEKLLPKIHSFLIRELQLSLHPDKVVIKTIASGVDFLGWVHFPQHRVLRTSTKKRMFKKIKQKDRNKAVLDSYRGMLRHGNTYLIQKQIDTII